MRIFKTFPLVILAGLLVTAPVAAQQAPTAEHVASSADAIDAALASHDLAVDRDRTRLAELLSTSEVRDLANARGIDMERVEAVAEGLTDAQMIDLAPLLETATEAMLVQRGTVTISVAAIIIILLVLILVT